MKFDFSLRSLFVIDLWFAMSIITSIIFEMTLISQFNGLISLSILIVGVIINLFVIIRLMNIRKVRKQKINN